MPIKSNCCDSPTNGYVLIPTNNCAPTNNDPGLEDFLEGFLVMMICMIIFFLVVALLIKILNHNSSDCDC